MKIALMSGAYVNAGDFLIEQRCKKLLESNITNAEVDILKRNVSYDDKIEELNSYDLIVFGGGPGYQKNMYPERMPFVSNLQEIKTPITIMGWGWKGRTNMENDLYGTNLSNQMLDFLNYIENQDSLLGCRDWYTLRFLKNQGLKNLTMTGCPAWYDLENIATLKKPEHVLEKENLNICISDAAFDSNKVLMKSLISFIREKYPTARIQMIFHRGITKGDNGVIQDEFVKKYAMEYKEITGGADGFKVYDDCDLHIGFRVHAHIYNLSRGNVSILLNEDARGNGVNDALGLQNINLNRASRFSRPNEEFMLKAVDDYLKYIVDTDYRQYGNASENIQFYYEEMKKYLRKLDS